MDTAPTSTLDAIVKFRTTPELKDRLKRVAKCKGTTLPDVCRDAAFEKVEREERKLKLAGK